MKIKKKQKKDTNKNNEQIEGKNKEKINKPQETPRKINKSKEKLKNT